MVNHTRFHFFSVACQLCRSWLTTQGFFYSSLLAKITITCTVIFFSQISITYRHFFNWCQWQKQQNNKTAKQPNNKITNNNNKQSASPNQNLTWTNDHLSRWDFWFFKREAVFFPHNWILDTVPTAEFLVPRARTRECHSFWHLETEHLRFQWTNSSNGRPFWWQTVPMDAHSNGCLPFQHLSVQMTNAHSNGRASDGYHSNGRPFWWILLAALSAGGFAGSIDSSIQHGSTPFLWTSFQNEIHLKYMGIKHDPKFYVVPPGCPSNNDNDHNDGGWLCGGFNRGIGSIDQLMCVYLSLLSLLLFVWTNSNCCLPPENLHM